MVELIWTEKAIKSLEDIAEFIANDSLFYAKKTVESIHSLTDTLKIFPKVGRRVPEYNKINIRELIYKTYRIIYKVEAKRIYILTVLSGYMDLTNVSLDDNLSD